MTTQIPSEPQVQPTMSPLAQPAPEKEKARRRLRIWLAVTVVVAVLALVALVVVLVRGNDGGDSGQGAPPSPTATSAPAPTTGPSPGPTTSTAPPTTAPTTRPPVDVDTATAVWPVVSSGVRYPNPVAAARGFATDFAGFRTPVVGRFMQGDNRSGEVKVRPTANGPATTVFVRKLEDDTWWVLGAAAPTIRLDAPSAGDAISSPVRLLGAAHTFEGNVVVTIREDGVPAPLGTGFVTGAGDQMGPFDGEVAFTRAPTQRYGAILLAEHSARNGELWQVSVVRVRFSR